MGRVQCQAEILEHMLSLCMCRLSKSISASFGQLKAILGASEESWNRTGLSWSHPGSYYIGGNLWRRLELSWAILEASSGSNLRSARYVWNHIRANPVSGADMGSSLYGAPTSHLGTILELLKGHTEGTWAAREHSCTSAWLAYIIPS